MDSFIVRFWYALRRRWQAGVVLLVLVGAVGATIILRAHPVHRSEAKLRVGEAPPMGGVSTGGGLFGMLRLGGDAFANDLELLSSRSLAEGVVDDATLHVKLTTPRGWYRDSLLTSLTATRATGKATYEIEWLTDGRIAVRSDTIVVMATPGEAVTFGGVTATFRAWRERMPRRVILKTIPHAEAARLTSGRMSVERTRRDANVVRIRYHERDPAVAQQAVSSAVARFISLRTMIQRRESGETVDSLRVVAAQAATELARAEEAIEALQRGTGFVLPEAQGEAFVERYATVGAQLELGRMELAALDSALHRARAATTADAWLALLAYPRFLENATLGELLSRMTQLEQARAELAGRRATENIEYRAVVDQIAFLDRSLRGLASDYRQALVQQTMSLERQSRELEQALAGVPRTAMDLARRQRQARILAEVTVLAEQRLRQEELRQALTFSNVQVIDPPALRGRPVWPRKKLGIAVVFLIACGTSLAGMLVMERADATIRQARELRTLLDAPVLAVIRSDAEAGSGVTAAEAAAVLRRGAVETPGHAQLVFAGIGADAAAAGIAARAVEAAAVLAERSVDVILPAPDLLELAPIDSFAAAAAAAATRLPLVLVVRAGTTTRYAAEHAMSLLRDAGAPIAGAIMVCSSARDAEVVWS